MKVTINETDGKTVATIAGRIDTTSAEQFQQDIAPLKEIDNPDIEIDCTDMEYTSSQGLRIFLMLQKCISEKGGKMVMTGMSPQVKRVFDITGFSNIIKII